jgi:hypothetical protein
MEKIALPNPLWWIFVGYAYMVQPNHLGQGKKGKNYYYTHAQLRTVLHTWRMLTLGKKEERNVQQLSTSQYAI